MADLCVSLVILALVVFIFAIAPALYKKLKVRMGTGSNPELKGESTGFLDKYRTGVDVPCLIIKNNGADLEYSVNLLDGDFIHNRNTDRKWTLEHAPKRFIVRDPLMPGVYNSYVCSDDFGSTAALEYDETLTGDTDRYILKLDAHHVHKMIANNHLLELFDMKPSTFYIWVNRIICLALGFLVGGFIVLIFLVII